MISDVTPSTHAISHPTLNKYFFTSAIVDAFAVSAWDTNETCEPSDDARHLDSTTTSVNTQKHVKYIVHWLIPYNYLSNMLSVHIVVETRWRAFWLHLSDVRNIIFARKSKARVRRFHVASSGLSTSFIGTVIILPEPIVWFWVPFCMQRSQCLRSEGCSSAVGFVMGSRTWGNDRNHFG